MAKFALILHPICDSPVQQIQVELTRPALDRLHLAYHLVGDLARLAIPEPGPSTRTNELWQHTCFEAFLDAQGGYYEFNVAPSSQWAAYRFDGYRTGMRDAVLPDPAVEWAMVEGRATLSVALPLPPDATGPLGLSSVIEGESGARSFWALAHPPGPPDFHNAACFTAELPSAS